MWDDAHGHTPVTVVARPETFGRLDVHRTVAAFAADCPGFWASSEFQECLAGGHIIAVDTSFFVEVCGYCISEHHMHATAHVAKGLAIPGNL